MGWKKRSRAPTNRGPEPDPKEQVLSLKVIVEYCKKQSGHVPRMFCPLPRFGEPLCPKLYARMLRRLAYQVSPSATAPIATPALAAIA